MGVFGKTSLGVKDPIGLGLEILYTFGYYLLSSTFTY